MGHLGFTEEFDQDDQSQVHSDRVIKAVQEEYKGEDYTPRFVVVIEYPADEKATIGKYAIASTGDNAKDTLRMLISAAMLTKRVLRLAGQDVALPKEVSEDAFLINVAEEVLKKEKLFDAMESDDIELSTSDKWLLAALNQGFGEKLYGEEKKTQLAEKFTKVVESDELKKDEFN